MKKAIAFLLISINFLTNINVYAASKNIMPAGQKFDIQIQETIDNDNDEDTPISFKLTDEYYEDIYPSEASFPKGTTLLGRITKVKKNSFFNRNAALTLEIDEAKLPNGTYIPISLKLNKVNLKETYTKKYWGACFTYKNSVKTTTIHQTKSIIGNKVPAIGTYWRKVGNSPKAITQAGLGFALLLGIFPPLALPGLMMMALGVATEWPYAFISAATKKGNGLVMQKGTLFTVQTLKPIEILEGEKL